MILLEQRRERDPRGLKETHFPYDQVPTHLTCHLSLAAKKSGSNSSVTKFQMVAIMTSGGAPTIERISLRRPFRRAFKGSHTNFQLPYENRRF